MKILSLVLVLLGIGLIGFGLYATFAPQDAYSLTVIKEGVSNGLKRQSLAMAGLGVLALIAGLFLTKKR